MRENTARLDSKKIANQNSNFNQQNFQQNNHAVIILASGLSRRLGETKQLLCKDGEPLIGYMLKLAASTNPQTIIVVIPDNAPDISNAIDKVAFLPSMVQIVINPAPKTGMAHSLSLAIEAITNLASSSIERILIMGVDQVLLDKKHLMALLAGNHAVVASRYAPANHGQKVENKNTIEQPKKNIVGMPLVIDYHLLKQWQPTLSGDKGLRHLIRALPPQQLSAVINPKLSYDIDTPEQLAYARQQGWVDATLCDNA